MNTGTPLANPSEAQSTLSDEFDSFNVYVAARAQRSRYFHHWAARIFGRKDTKQEQPNADGLAPLGMTN